VNLPPLHTLPDWSDFRRVCVDIETKDPKLTELGPGVRRKDGYITGVAFACDDGTNNGPACYLPIRHAGGNYENPEAVLEYFRYQARHFRGDIVGTNLQYDLDWLQEEGVTFTPRFYRDIQISGPLLLVPKVQRREDPITGEVFYTEAFQHMNLDAQARRLGLPGKDEAGLKAWAEQHGLDPKKDMWRAPAWIVNDYAVQDVRLPLQVIKLHEREIAEQASHDPDPNASLQTIYDLECRLQPVLLKMRRRGVAVDLNKLEQIESLARERTYEAMKEVSRLSGVRVTETDINKAAALAPALEADGVKVPRTPRRISEKTGREVGGQYSVKAAWLQSLDTPVAKAIQEARRWDKISSTFCASIRRHEINGRIHCTFNQLKAESDDGTEKGVSFGRLSSSDPNLQQQPARDPEIGPLWRSIYLPDDGGEWACLDFSSQEPRMITHYAELAGCDGGAEAAEACRTDPHWDNHSMMAGFCYQEYSAEAYRNGDKAMKELRGHAKTIFLGRCYGMGGGKLCRGLGLPTVKVVRDPRVREWLVHDVNSPDGKALLLAGQKPFYMAGPEGQAILDKFDAGVPYIKQLTRMVQNKAKKMGYIRTLLGRRRRFARLSDGRLFEGHKALNGLIQGGSADQTKLAMVLADEAGIRLQLQVHDELDLTIWDRREAEQLNEIMVHAVELNVPTKCDIEVGPNWGEIK